MKIQLFNHLKGSQITIQNMYRRIFAHITRTADHYIPIVSWKSNARNVAWQGHNFLAPFFLKGFHNEEIFNGVHEVPFDEVPANIIMSVVVVPYHVLEGKILRVLTDVFDFLGQFLSVFVGQVLSER